MHLDRTGKHCTLNSPSDSVHNLQDHRTTEVTFFHLNGNVHQTAPLQRYFGNTADHHETHSVLPNNTQLPLLNTTFYVAYTKLFLNARSHSIPQIGHRQRSPTFISTTKKQYLHFLSIITILLQYPSRVEIPPPTNPFFSYPFSFFPIPTFCDKKICYRKNKKPTKRQNHTAHRNFSTI